MAGWVFRQPAGGDVRDEAFHQPIAVGELEAFVEPGLRLGWKLAGQLAGRHHDLVIAIFEVVAFDVDVVELVIKTDLLGLAIGLEDGAPVPEPNVADRVLVLIDGRQGQIGEARVGLFLDVIDTVGSAGEVNVGLQVRRFQPELVGQHAIALH